MKHGLQEVLRPGGDLNYYYLTQKMKADPAQGEVRHAVHVATMTTASTKQELNIIQEEMMVPAPDEGIELYIRNKRLSEMSSFEPARTVLFVHGATYPSSTTFDLQLDGLSWMDYIASRGYDVYALDLRGYGKSTRPKEMADDPAQNGPIVRGETAVKDIAAVVDYILKRCNIARLNLIGWSWGCTLIATYATTHSNRVERLALYAPIWIRQTPSLLQAGPGPLGAYRTVTREQAKQRWGAGIPEDKKSTLIPPGWFEAWADATWKSDQEGAKLDPPVVRAPNGVVADTADYFGAGKPYYDPSKITVPTLLIGAEWDRDAPPYMAQTLFPLLINAPDKRYVQLAEGTHSIMMERNRLKLFEAVQAFLEEAAKPKSSQEGPGI